MLDLSYGTSKQTKKAESSSSSGDTFVTAKAGNQLERTFLIAPSRLTKVFGSSTYRRFDAFGAPLATPIFGCFVNHREPVHRLAHVRVMATP